jgi:hypothetical protein
MRSFLMALLLSFTTLSNAAESVATLKDARALCDAVMKELGSGNMKEGLTKLKPYTLVPQAEFEVQLNNLSMQMPIMNQRFGDAIGYEFISQDESGESIVKFTYIQKLEHHVTLWRFLFYKPKEVWLLNTWWFDDKIQQAF